MKLRAYNNIGGITVDGILKADHNSSLTITKHPVESGGDITDHSRINPRELTLEVAMSDAGSVWVRGGEGRSVTAYQALLRLQASGEPFSISSRLGSYKNVLITNLSAPDDYTTMHGLKSTVFMEEIIIVDSSTVGVKGRSKQPQKTGSTNNGTLQAAPVNSGENQSVLAGIKDILKGNLGLGGS